MKIRLYAVIAGTSLAIFLAGPALAKDSVHDSISKPARHVHGRHVHHGHAGLGYAQSFYDYHSASSVREIFMDAPHGGRFGRYGDRREGRYGTVVQNLHGDFDGGVGYGVDGVPEFTDGYGQVHFYTGAFAPRAGFGPGGNRFGMRPGFDFRQGSPRGR